MVRMGQCKRMVVIRMGQPRPRRERARVRIHCPFIPNLSLHLLLPLIINCFTALESYTQQILSP
jgi:hypothetical protein